jgi:hypothetical protein
MNVSTNYFTVINDRNDADKACSAP